MTILTINGDKYEHDNYPEAEKALLDAVRYWNNFGDETPLQFTLSKTDDPDALNVKTKDVIHAEEALNRPEENPDGPSS